MTVKEILNKALMIEILKGMQLTFKRLVSKAVTIQYPFEKRKIWPGFRGRHAFVRDPFTGKDKCIGCMTCARVCPAKCITIKKEKIDNKMVTTEYKIDASRCIFCGYCVESCPVCALVLTEEYEYSAYSRDEFIFNTGKLLKNWDDFVKKWPEETYFNKFWQPPGIDPNRWPKTKKDQTPIPLRGEALIKAQEQKQSQAQKEGKSETSNS